MANMSYCRFRNTLNDLRDCYDHLSDDLIGPESEAAAELIYLCALIAEESEYKESWEHLAFIDGDSNEPL